MNNEYDVFISYATKDRERVSELKTKLEGAGIKTWTDQEIIPGQSWAEEIRKAIETSRYALILVSESSLKSEGANFETGVALSRVRGGKEIQILPVVDPGIELSRLPFGLKDYQSVNAQDVDKLVSQLQTFFSQDKEKPVSKVKSEI